MAYMNRRTYAWIVVALFVGCIAMALIPGVARLGPKFNVPFNISFFAVIALLTGARLAHAGYPRWIGIAGVPVIIVGWPIVVAIVGYLAFHIRTPEALMRPVGLGITILLLAFLIWAGTRRGEVDSNDRFEQARPNGRFAPASSKDRMDRVLNRTPRTFG